MRFPFPSGSIRRVTKGIQLVLIHLLLGRYRKKEQTGKQTLGIEEIAKLLLRSLISKRAL